MRLDAQLPPLDLLQLSQIYMVGIKGVGMTACAVMLQEAGLVVSGADLPESFVTDRILREKNIHVEAFSEASIPENTDAVIYSGAHQGADNFLVREAQLQSIPCLTLAQAVGLLSRAKPTIAVCGVGGKSTTSALLSWIFTVAGHRPSYAVGVGNIPNLGQPGHWEPGSEYFIVEADEYVADPTTEIVPRLLYLQPTHAICTSIAFDHPDVYQSFEDTKAVFAQFFSSVQGKIIYNADLPELEQLVKAGRFTNAMSVGWADQADIVLSDWQIKNGISQAQVGSYGQLKMTVPGKHNFLNAAYAAVLAAELGISWENIQAAVLGFRSTQRRLEFRGITTKGARCYDDYAHHPREIAAIISTLQEWFANKKIVVAFQPHTFSRTRELFSEFQAVLQTVPGQVWLLPIFASAREADDPNTNSQQLVEALQQNGQDAQLLSDLPSLVKQINALPEDTVVFTLGAGDIYKVYDYVEFRETF